MHVLLSLLMTEIAVPAEMFVTLYHNTRGNTPEEKKLNTFVFILFWIFIAELVSYPEMSGH
jgi:hypothetical protein